MHIEVKATAKHDRVLLVHVSDQDAEPIHKMVEKISRRAIKEGAVVLNEDDSVDRYCVQFAGLSQLQKTVHSRCSLEHWTRRAIILAFSLSQDQNGRVLCVSVGRDDKVRGELHGSIAERSGLHVVFCATDLSIHARNLLGKVTVPKKRTLKYSKIVQVQWA